MIKAIIFDLDDTLFPETEFAMSGFRAVAKELESTLKTTQEELFSRMRSLYFEDRTRVFNRLFEMYGIKVTPDELQHIVQIYRYHEPEITCFYDAFMTLVELKKHGYKLGVISNGYSTVQRTKLKALGVLEFFDEIIISEDLGEYGKKPNLLPFQTMKERMGVEYNEMMYIGDNPSADFYVGSITEIHTVRVDYGGVYCNNQYWMDIKEKYAVCSISAVLGLIK